MGSTFSQKFLGKSLYFCQLQKELSIIRICYSQAIQDSFDSISQELEARIKQQEDRLNLSQADRKRIADIANNFRIEEIDNLRQEMEQFKSAVEEIWSKPSEKKLEPIDWLSER